MKGLLVQDEAGRRVVHPLNQSDSIVGRPHNLVRQSLWEDVKQKCEI